MSYDRCCNNSENFHSHKRKSRLIPRDPRDWREVGRRSVTISYMQYLCGNACAPIGGHARIIGPHVCDSLMSTSSYRSRHESHSAIPRTIGHLVTHGLSPTARGVARMLRPASYFRTCDAHGASRCLAARDTCTSLRRLSFRYSVRKVTRISASHFFTHSYL